MTAILLGLVDLIAGIFMLLLHFDILPWRFVIGFALYFIAKGYIFKGDFLSLVDLLLGVYMILMLFGIKTFLVYLFFAYLIYKVILCFIPMNG